MSNIQYIDIHSHLNFPQYDVDREGVIASLKEKGIATITVGTDFAMSKSAVELAEKYDNLYATVGVHPDDDSKTGFNDEEFETLFKNKKTKDKIVAIGECGLDYAGDHNKQAQKELFEKQIAFAVAHDKPLMIHCRDAYPDTLDILASKKKEYGDKLRANFHFFTESIETAGRILDLDFTVSFTGVITFVKAYAELVAYVPIEKMMSETDAPFVAPVPYRGKRNSPEHVIEIVKKIADIKKRPLEEVKEYLMENAKRVFSVA